ncbi:response regulator [Methanosphaerula palustris]|uniref:histidine kinase n=1 Tax=Methanosphaerula palustris (strain ATCC BAA-1556 / DSM 19958 / E1-9c) TaxID=521011 RepID=B8GIC2_METPE|nr:response regulator [Methanosphaerula palustris]ACL15473.1 signal transduction histidine kinase [Methanosphaerula palustris E1-9c]
MFHVLYVDDESDLLNLGKIFLEQSHQITIDTATSAEDALTCGNLQTYDAVISDYQMPGMNGITFLKEVRSRYRDLPFILFTGRGREEVVIEAIDSGVDHYVQKGGDPRPQFAELEHRVLQAIEARQGKVALQESEERFRSLFTSIFNGFAHHQIICDAEGRPVDYRFIDVNPAFERLTGLKRNEILGKTVLEVLPDIEPFWIERYGRTALTGKSQSFEQFTAALNRYYEVTVYSPRPGEFTTLFSDITSQKQAEEILRERETKFRTIVETSPDMIWEIDTRGIFTYLSPQIGDILGYSTEEMLGKPILFLIIPSFIPTVQKILGSHLQSREEINTFEVPAHHADGTPRSIEIRSAKIRDKTGQVTGFRGIARDVTERRRAEEELKESEASYHGLFNTIRQTIFILDQKGRFLDANDGAVSMYGYPREAFLGRYPEFLSAPGMNDLKKIEELIQKAFTGEPQQIEYWGVRKNGEIFPKDVRFYKGTYFGEEVLISIATDITEQRHASDTIRLSHTLLEVANRPLDCPVLLQEYLQVIQEYAGCDVVGIHLFDQAGMTPYEIWSGNPGAGDAFGNPLSRIVDETISTAVIEGVTDPDLPIFTSSGSFFINATTTGPTMLQKEAGDPTWNLTNQADFESVALVPLWQNNRVIGLICLADRREQRVPLARVVVIEEVTPQMITAIQRVAAEDRIRNSLEEKEVMMKEIHHRVKNNLAVIISLIDLQADDITDEQTLQLLHDLRGRVATMALVHEFLYGSRDLSQINFGQYLQDLVPKLIQSLGGSTPVKVLYEVDQALLPLEIAVPCGLIVNELVTNSLKYAFPIDRPIPADTDQACTITVSFMQTQDGFILSVGDNGAGLPERFDWTTTKTLGFQLVRALACHQLRGRVDLEERDGTRFTIHIPWTLIQSRE